MPFTFKISEKIKEAWILYKNNFKDILPLALIMLVIQYISQSISKNDNTWPLSLILMIASIYISYLWYISTLDLIDGKGFKPFSKETIPTWAKIWDFIKTNILMVLCVIPFFIIPAGIFVLFVAVSIIPGGILNILPLLIVTPILILFIIPVIYISGRLFPAKYLSVEKSQGARKSVKEAWNMTKGNGWSIVWKVILITLFIILGFIAFFVGIIITFPIGMMVLAMMYRELAKSTNNTTIISKTENQKEEIKEEPPVTVTEEIVVEVVKEEIK